MRGLPRFLGFVAYVLACAWALMLPGCANTPAKVEIHEIPGPTQYVPIDPKLTEHPALPPKVTTTPIQAPKVAQERRVLLERCYIQLDQIRAIEGTKP